MTNTFESVCNRTLRNLDAFLDGELDERAASAVQQHVDECLACSRELHLRNDLRSRLRSAARSASSSAFLQTRVLAELRNRRRAMPFWTQRLWVSAAAAVLMVTAGLSVSYQAGYLPLTSSSHDQYVDSMLRKVSSGMRPGLSDHIHCAVFRKYRKQAPPLESLRTDLGTEYRTLIDVVRASVPAEYSVHVAHQCTLRGRSFVHIALRSNSKVMSLVLTRRRSGETLADNEVAPVISRGGLDLYGASVQPFHISGFETLNGFAYLVSEIEPGETHRILLAMAPDVRAILAKLPS
jgi:anti-sigma factor (TIGR02949 family)